MLFIEINNFYLSSQWKFVFKASRTALESSLKCVKIISQYKVAGILESYNKTYYDVKE